MSIDNGWVEYRRLVLNELKRNSQSIERIEKELGHLANSLDKRLIEIEQASAVAKAKASVYGGVAGLVLGFIPTIISFINGTP